MSLRPIERVAIPMQVVSGRLRSIAPHKPHRTRRRNHETSLLELRLDVAGQPSLTLVIPAAESQVLVAKGDALNIAYVDYPRYKKVYALRNHTQHTVHLAASAKPITPLVGLSMALLLLALGGVVAYAVLTSGRLDASVLLPMVALLFALETLVILQGHDPYLPGSSQPGGSHHLRAACKALALSRKESRRQRPERRRTRTQEKRPAPQKR